MNKDVIKDVLRFNSEEFTYEEIIAMLNEELEKEPENMDTELVELCTEVIGKYSAREESFVATEQQKTKKVKRLSVRKSLVIAAAAGIAVLAMAIPAGAYISKIIENEHIIREFEDMIILDFSNGTNFHIEKEFEYYKLGCPTLPRAFGAGRVIYNSSEQLSDDEARFGFVFKETELTGSIHVIKTEADTESVLSQKYIREKAVKYDTVETRFGNIAVYTLPGKNSVYCMYCYEGICYSIAFDNSDFDSVTKLLG